MSEPREKALLSLYERHSRGSTEIPEGRAGDLVEGVLERIDDIDRLIESASSNWSVQRMAAVDASVLRLGVFELISRPETPTGVIINEAVELAKRYSTEQSGSFVNGVLAAVAINPHLGQVAANLSRSALWEIIADQVVAILVSTFKTGPVRPERKP